MAAFKFNTAVAALMAWLNALTAARDTTIGAAQWREALATFCVLLAPVAPFITEEVWQRVLGHETTVHRQRWPRYDEETTRADEVEVVVQVNGKVRDTMTVAAATDEATLIAMALARPNVQRHVDGRQVRRTIVVPQRLVNIVV
jgi:leucyl-tRNA synthetase